MLSLYNALWNLEVLKALTSWIVYLGGYLFILFFLVYVKYEYGLRLKYVFVSTIMNKKFYSLECICTCNEL